MLYDLHNPTLAARIVYDRNRREVRVNPGATVNAVDLHHDLVQILYQAKGDLVVSEHRAAPSTSKSVSVDGMWGIGDNLHQRAVMRELMKNEEVWLTTCHWHVYHDLIPEGLHLNFKATHLRAQAKTIERERGLFKPVPVMPAATRQIKLWYRKDQIDKYGSILQAMAGTCGVDHTKPLDFSLPVPDDWASKLAIDPGDKPIMVYRPVVLRREWNSANRNPDPVAYRALYDAIRGDFYTISIADLLPGEEWIVGEEAPADLKLHTGELSFLEMASLFKRARLAFTNAGFGPVLAQAVGTPVVIVYGGRESYRTTQRAGEHLAHSLGIDPIKPCDCHTEKHDCGDKRIDVPVALERIKQFAAEINRSAIVPVIKTPSDTLVFATTYVDNPDRQHLTELWLKLTRRLNPDADLLIVDSASPTPVVRPEFKKETDIEFELFDFGNNVGHLSRKGRDGWGRAFCKGLDLAVERGYRWVAHIEGDSLFRLPVKPIFENMAKHNHGASSVPVKGMERDIITWVETGLMFFSTEFLKRSNFTANYNWPVREVRPTPEKVIFHMLDGHLNMLPIKAARCDKRQFNHDNVVANGYDWITHAHNDIWAYDRFYEAVVGNGQAVSPAASSSHVDSLTIPQLKLNLGCGTNKLDGWENHDIDVDITKPLPWADSTVDFIFIEHCVEHVTYKQAIGFFEEAYRVLKPGGVLRVTVPSIEQIMACTDQGYFDFAKKWGGEATLHGAAKSILFSHGHEMAWTASLMTALLAYAGFGEVEACDVGQSSHPDLAGLEGHGKVIGDRFNRIESMCCEATKVPRPRPKPPGQKVAVIIGGGNEVLADLQATDRLMTETNAEPTFFVINDMIPRFERPCIAVSLHPQKLSAWLNERARIGLPAPIQVWAHNNGTFSNPHTVVTNVTDDWRGSSGLFAIKVARELGFERIILCGVPMQAERQHFLRRALWNAAGQFKPAWLARKAEIAPYVRSVSGWTAELLGRPNADFLSA